LQVTFHGSWAKVSFLTEQPSMSFAKEFFDVGLFTNQADSIRAFYNQLGLTFDHTLKLGGGVLQHRYPAGGAVLKINDARDPLPRHHEPAPLIELIIASTSCSSPNTKVDPDGTRVTSVPAGHQGIQGLALRLRVRNSAISSAFYTTAIGMSLVSPGVLSCGHGLLLLEDAPEAIPDQAPLAALGLRYLTLQVFDCDAAYASALKAGATSGRAPVTLGDTARIAFVRDPDGIWIELSERASVTGKAV
jgi:catechol 2,3-dioxygenase-like lactoylglutathione lyase family enzyme